jgi:hypothetical protein
MSPEERANRLFNRVMILAEAGKTDSVQFFLPMALGAYSQLPNLDADAHYHVGNVQEERRAYADFLRNESAELAQKRPEYGQGAHLEALTNFHSEAERKTRSGGRTS